jgi:peptide chain release factor subunit 1
VIGTEGVARLLAMTAPGHGIVSVYLTVPLDPAQRRGMTAQLDDLLAAGHQHDGTAEAWTRARQREAPAIRRLLTEHTHEWPGRSVAIFACTELGLLEAVPLRGQIVERAVIGSRPYVRPLLAEVERCPSYVTAVVDRRHAWLFWVSGDGIEPGEHLQSQTVGSRRFGGWHGFQSYRNDQRARTLARQHYATVAAAVAAAVGSGDCGPVVAGGHETETREFLAALPPALRGRVAGTFVIDPHAMTPARVRQLADEVVGRWEEARERELAAALAEQAAGGMTAIGLDACVTAANQHAIQLLMVPDDEVAPGFSCGGCGALAVTAAACPGCGEATQPVGDVIEELAVKVKRDGGRVQPMRSTSVLRQIAARRRFPALA